MNHNPNQPRLLADFAAVPTRRERAGARGYWRRQQTDLFAAELEPAAMYCNVCGSEQHHTDACPHGIPLTLI